MQDTKLNAKLDLSEFYNSDNLSDLFNVFPKLKSNITQRTSMNSPYINKIYVDKFSFYQMILEKIKNYFEINESFIISKSISIILKDIKSIIDSSNSMKNKNFHVLNNVYSTHKRSQSKDTLKIKRTLSTKSNGKNKINEQIKRKAYNIFFDFEKEKNLCDINKVYMNLNKDKQPKIKMVHFMNEDLSKNKSPKPKIKAKKSNLKKIKSKRELNVTKSIALNESNLDSNEYSSRTRKTSFNDTKTETSIRNKSNGIKFQEREGHNPNVTNYKIKQEISYDYDLLTNSNDNSIDNKDFDIFNLSTKVGKGNVLPLIGNYIFTKYNFNEFMNITKFRNWCEKISKGYINTNYYHNSLHAADITHTCYIYIKEGAINDKIGLSPKSLCALYLSCICHDYKHPGLNNNFLIQTKHPLSLKYNDASVLENMHVSEAFKLINEDIDCNIFENMDNSEYKTFRKQMISCVLSTDMVNHGNSLNFLKKCLKEDFIQKEEDKQDYMNLLIHSADISNPTKKFDVYFKWAKLVVEEFYYQGDKEKELGLKCSCDRNIVTIYKSQLGFIDYVINPFFGEFVKVFPKLNYLYDNVQENRKTIKQMEDDDKNNKN